MNNLRHLARNVAVYAGTRNLYERMIPAIKSLIRNSNVDVVYLLIEDDVFPYWLPDSVETINVANQPYFDSDGPNFNTKFTYMSLMRLALTKILPQHDLVLYLDVDTIVRRDISALWRIDMLGYYFAGVTDIYQPVKGWPYINAGVMLMNLKELREDGMDDKLIQAVNTRWYKWNEQDAINDLCRGRIMTLDGAYNASRSTTLACTPKITHYTAQKDWTNDPAYRQYDAISWTEVLEACK